MRASVVAESGTAEGMPKLQNEEVEMTDRRVSGKWDRRAAVHNGAIVGCECQHMARPERRVDDETRAAFPALLEELRAKEANDGNCLYGRDCAIGIRAGLRYRKGNP